MLKAITFSQTTYNLLSDDLYGVDWLLKLEELEQKKAETERSIRDLRLTRLPSNGELIEAMAESLGRNFPVSQDAQRQEALRAIVRGFEESLYLAPAQKNFKQEKLVPQLQALYLLPDKFLLREDFRALERVDKAGEIDKQIAELEEEVKKIGRQLEGHRGNVLRCFRGGILPRTLGETLHDAETALHSGRPMDEVGELILRKFGRDWRQRAVLFLEPISVHGVSIASMSSDRKKVWQKAYQKMRLEPNLKTPYFQATFETRRTEAPMPKGEFFDKAKPVATSA